MAVTEKWGVTWLEVVWDGTADYTITQPLLLRSIRFRGSAANDKLTVRQRKPGESTVTNWPAITLQTIDGGNIACFEPAPLERSRAVYLIDYSECTFTTPANIQIAFVFEPL